MRLDISRLEALLIIDEHRRTILVLGVLGRRFQALVDLGQALGVISSLELDGEAERRANESGGVVGRKLGRGRSDVEGENRGGLLRETSVESRNAGGVAERLNLVDLGVGRSGVRGVVRREVAFRGFADGELGFGGEGIDLLLDLQDRRVSKLLRSNLKDSPSSRGVERHLASRKQRPQPRKPTRRREG